MFYRYIKDEFLKGLKFDLLILISILLVVFSFIAAFVENEKYERNFPEEIKSSLNKSNNRISICFPASFWDLDLSRSNGISSLGLIEVATIQVLDIDGSELLFLGLNGEKSVRQVVDDVRGGSSSLVSSLPKSFQLLDYIEKGTFGELRIYLSPVNLDRNSITPSNMFCVNQGV